MPPQTQEEEEIPAKELLLPQLADEYARYRMLVQAWRPALNPHAQRFSELQAELLFRHVKEPADKRIQVQGEYYIVPISPRENESKFTDPTGLYKKLRRLGLEKLLELYSITLTKARKVLTEKEQARFISTERSGARSIGEPVLKDAR